MHIEYLTSNANKFAEAKQILSSWALTQINIDLPEIQGDAQAVIRAKAKSAFELLKRPLIVEDVSLSCPAIGGLPGPYIKDFLLKIGSQGLFELIDKYADHSVQVSCLVAYIAEEGQPIIFEGTQKGKIVAPRFSPGFKDTPPYHQGWDPIVQPAGMSKTYGEFTMDERSKLSMRFLALKQLDRFLKEIHYPEDGKN